MKKRMFLIMFFIGLLQAANIFIGEDLTNTNFLETRTNHIILEKNVLISNAYFYFEKVNSNETKKSLLDIDLIIFIPPIFITNKKEGDFNIYYVKNYMVVLYTEVSLFSDIKNFYYVIEIPATNFTQNIFHLKFKTITNNKDSFFSESSLWVRKFIFIK